jgi:hypothetical protein
VARTSSISSHRTTQLFGQETAQFIAILNDVAEKATQLWHQCTDEFSQCFTNLLNWSKPRSDPTEPRNTTTSSCEDKQQRCRVLPGKVNKQLTRAFGAESDPWSVCGTELHWKLWRVSDPTFHLFFQRFDFISCVREAPSALRRIVTRSRSVEIGTILNDQANVSRVEA